MGEIRRRWAGILALDQPVHRGEIEEGEFSEDSGGDDSTNESDVDWSTPENSLRVQADPLIGLRSEGAGSHFWGTGSDSPSVDSMIRRAHAAGISSQEVQKVDALLYDPITSEKACAINTPASMNSSDKLARTVIKALIDGRQKKPAAGTWKGLLPPPRSSPPLTLGDLPIKQDRRRTKASQEQASNGKTTFQISNPDPVSSRKEGSVISGADHVVFVPCGATWARFRLSQSVGRLLARRGTLPDQFRDPACPSTLAGGARPSYVQVVKRLAMEGGGHHGHAQGGFNGGNGGGIHGHGHGGFNGGNGGGMNQGAFVGNFGVASGGVHGSVPGGVPGGPLGIAGGQFLAHGPSGDGFHGGPSGGSAQFRGSTGGSAQFHGGAGGVQFHGPGGGTHVQGNQWGGQFQGQQLGHDVNAHMGGGQGADQGHHGWNYGSQQGGYTNPNFHLSQNQQATGSQDHSKGGFSETLQAGFGRGGHGNSGFNPGFDGPSYGPGSGWHKQRGKSRGTRGGKHSIGRTQPLNMGN